MSNFQFTLSLILVLGFVLGILTKNALDGDLSTGVEILLRLVGLTCVAGLPMLMILSVVGIVGSYRAAKEGEDSRYWFAIPFAKAGNSS